MARRISLTASAGLYWISFVGLAFLALVVSSWYSNLGADPATQGASGDGMAAFYLLVMSPFATLGHSAALAFTNWWRRRRNQTELGALWIPVLSACLWLVLGYTGLPTLLIAVSDFIFGWSSEWSLALLPFGIAAVGTGTCVLLATVRWQPAAVPHDDTPEDTP